MNKKFLWITGIIFLLACQTLMPKAASPSENSALPATRETVAAWQIFPPLSSSTPVIISPTPNPTLTFSPVPTITLTPTSTPVLIPQGPGEIIMPILLYHHVETPDHESRYYVTPEDFDAQMNLLHEWGYTTITFDLLLKAIKEGADLPERPLLITFDDGQLSVYTNAFPIMQKYGFTGIVYIVGRYMDAPTFMTADQIKQLTQAGWEVGSHGMSHKNLTTLKPDQQVNEISESRKLLSEALGVQVNSFAYPFGFSSEDVFTIVHNSGYTSAVGVGYTNSQRRWNIFLLNRRDVLGTYDLQKFASFLPWYGEP